MHVGHLDDLGSPLAAVDLPLQRPNTCADNGSGNAGCNGDDLGGANGITYGAGAVVGGSGNATFVARLSNGSTGSLVPGVYEAGAKNKFHVVIRSHGRAPANRAAHSDTYG